MLNFCIDVRSMRWRLCATLLLLPPLSLHAEILSDDGNFSLIGFLTITGGKVVSGNINQATYTGSSSILGNNCPCYTADYSNGGVYGGQWSFSPETRAGVQAQYDFSDSGKFVTQLASRGTDVSPDFQLVYLGYKINDNWEIHLGRQRIPFYYYSLFQDIGFTYPWVNVPAEIYGWEATNFNGGSLIFSNALHDVGVRASVFSGTEKINDSPYYLLNYAGDTSVTWKNLFGTDLELNKGALVLRLVYLRANTRAVNAVSAFDISSTITTYGAALNADFDKWFVLSEFTQQTRDFSAQQYQVRAPAFTVGVGMRLGNWTPFINYARYSEHSSDLTQYQPQNYHRSAFTLRYNLDQHSDIKAQIDRNIDSTSNFGGNATVFRISYDRVF